MSQRKVIFDTNFFQRLNMIDPGCGHFEYFPLAYDGDPICDCDQIEKIGYCENLPSSMGCHNISDEDSIMFVNSWDGKANLAHLMNDPADVKLIVHALRGDNSLLISCDKLFLIVAEELALEHRCFKASFADVNKWAGGEFKNDPTLNANIMFHPGDDPFLYYTKNSRCHQCDPNNDCDSHGN
ncbi:MAG: hypothetical protein AB2768_02265 [Candidatus Thiodiazotropha endolucinida]